MFKNITLKTRLMLQASLLILFMLWIGFFGFMAVRSANEGAHDIYVGGVDSLEYLVKLQNTFKIDIGTTIHKMRDDIISFEEGSRIIRQSLNKITQYLEDYAKTGTYENQKAEFDRLKISIKNATAFIEKLLENANAQNKEKFVSLVKTEFYPIVVPTMEEINQIMEAHVSVSKIDYENAITDSIFYESIMLLMIVVTGIIALIFSYYSIRSITDSLDNTIEILEKLSLGDNSVEIETQNTHNEIGKMLLALKKMVESIRKMTLPLIKVSQGDLTGTVEARSEKDILAHSINDMIEKLRKMIVKTREEIIVIAGSVEEVISSVSEVSAGTTETAAAVTETTTTVEELQQTAQVSSSKADDVLKSSEETLKVVKAGELSLKNTIGDMTHIQEKMNVISESIVKLSEHSLVIGDIITSVNELAEQSNLLAVNAAIEAAKAGEQGKGFGVVAQEIRTLAEQSKAATTQVRSILNDIQNATGTAVMATEQGSKAVEKGVKQSHETNNAMQSLLNNMTQVSQAAKQIAISGQQQLIGVEQVRSAMTNINLASEQHVEHMKQIEQAVHSLNEVSKNLKELISQYKISEK